MAERFFRILVIFGGLLLFGGFPATAADKKPREGRGATDWIATEYGSQRTAKDMQTVYASKGFAWLSGSPADNEKLSIGKNAQLFGFVALRYQSG